MAKSTVLPFELPSEFSPDPLTEVIQNGAKALLHTAIQAEVSSFISEHAHLLDEAVRTFVMDERKACESDREWKFRLRGYGYDVTSTSRGTVLSTLPHGVEICTLDA